MRISLKDFDRKRRRVFDLQWKMREARAEANILLQILRKNCKHGCFVEFDNNMARLGDIRICLDCGLKDVHEGAGFHTITGDRPHRLISKAFFDGKYSTGDLAELDTLR